MHDDEEAFGALGAAYGMPRETDEEKTVRSGAIQSALVGAVAPPRAIAAICDRLAGIAAELAEDSNQNLFLRYSASARLAPERPSMERL
jgi:formiminotetrahydrofolate cyclodeaminase